jgi:hypothetical protein
MEDNSYNNKEQSKPTKDQLEQHIQNTSGHQSSLEDEQKLTKSNAYTQIKIFSAQLCGLSLFLTCCILLFQTTY